jgi:shikimate kinase
MQPLAATTPDSIADQLRTRPWQGRIFVIGMMGCGKSTVGRELAEQLGWPYWDNDVALLRATRLDAAQLAALGPPGDLHAREHEQAVAACGAAPPLVASLAASITERPALHPMLRQSAWLVYLRAELEMLATRVGNGGGRPWLASDPRSFLGQTLVDREPRYRRLAHAVLDVDDLPPHAIARRVLEAMAR